MKFIFTIICFLGCAFLNAQSLLTSSITWKNHENKEVKLSDFSGKNIALTMLYTECKKTCPMVTMKAMYEIESYYKKIKTPIEFVLISFDPEVDTPEVLKEFKKKQELEENWHLLVGSKNDTREFAKSIGLGEYWKMDDHILHGFKVLIIDQEGRSKYTLDWDHRTIESLKSNDAK